MNLALDVENLTLRFNSFVAVNKVSMAVEAGSRRAIIGPNGAGKTSFVHALTGAIAASAGTVRICGADATGLSQAARVHRGLARTFQINQLFAGLTVLENVLIAVTERDGRAGIFWRALATERRAIEEARGLVDLVGLGARAGDPVSALPYGRRRLVEIAIALATRPKVLILDEPAAGVPTTQSEAIFERIAALPRDLTVLFIEHDMNLVFRFAERITVLVAGEVLTEGTPGEISRDERVREVYLGRRGHHAAA